MSNQSNGLTFKRIDRIMTVVSFDGKEIGYYSVWPEGAKPSKELDSWITRQTHETFSLYQPLEDLLDWIRRAACLASQSRTQARAEADAPESGTRESA